MAVLAALAIIAFGVSALQPRAASSELLEAVSAGPGGSAWAVGWSCVSCGTPSATYRTLILRWNSSAWSRVPSPSPGNVAILRAVSAAPGSGAWAVGWACTSGCLTGAETDRTLILRWNGSSWSQVPSPSPSQQAALYGVTAGQGGSAWAAGSSCASLCGTSMATYRTLILRWNGFVWSQVPSPSPSSASLRAISAGPGGSAWAAGWSCVSPCATSPGADRTLILRWNGSTWSQVPSPSPSSAGLQAVSAGPGGSAWAAGWSCASHCGAASPADRTLILRWNGSTWSQVPSPSPGRYSILSDVKTAPWGSAWAVGRSCVSLCGTPSQADRPLVLRWNGAVWSQAASPSPGNASLAGVTAAPDGSAWAAGDSCAANCDNTAQADHMLILHWTGSTWSTKSP